MNRVVVKVRDDECKKKMIDEKQMVNEHEW